MNFSYFLACLTLTTLVSAKARQKPQKYAVLVATTKSWSYYRHQSTILHAYHTLVSNGVPKNNIFTMFYDDIANDPHNPEPGVIQNHPFGPNLYTKNLTKSYIGNNVNAKNFLAVLTGDKNTTSGPVINSGPKDTIFIYISGMGTYRALTFPTGPSLPADKFVNALKQIRSEKKAKKIFVMLDVAFAASLVHGIVPRHDKIIVSTATHFEELPYAVYCQPEKRICYATLYGAAWTQYSDRLRKMRFGRRENLFTQFNRIRTLTVKSHVNLYGEIEMGKSKLREFVGYKEEKKQRSDNYTSPLALKLAKSALMGAIERADEDFEEEEEEGEEYNEHQEYSSERLEDNKQEDQLSNIMNEVDILPTFMRTKNETEDETNISTKRQFVEDTMRNILQKLDIDFDSLEEPSVDLSLEAARDYEKSIEAFSSTCININENMYVLKFLSKLAKVCEMRIPLKTQYAAMLSACTEEHRQITFVH